MRKTIILSLTLSILVCLTLLALYPDAADFRLGNPFWNGMSEVDRILKPTILNSYDELPPAGYNLTLLLIGPDRDFTLNEAEAIARFIYSSGQVVLADELGFGNSLLEKLNLSVRIGGGLVLDPLFKERSARLPKARYISDSYTAEIVLNHASIIQGCSKPILQTSSFSYIDVNMNNEWDPGEEKGPFTVGCALKIGGGELIVFSDSSLFINSMVNLGSNKELILDIIRGRKVLVDSSHWSETISTAAKKAVIEFIGLLSTLEARYALIISAIILVARFIPTKRKTINRVAIEDILKLNPSWDKDVLEKLAREIRGG
jgi:hypothetical protein